MAFRRKWTTVVFVLFVAILLLGLLFIESQAIVYSSDYADSDFFSFWLAGHMMWTGQSPYASQPWIAAHSQFGADWISDPTFLYPLPLALLLAPLGLLDLGHAYVMWVFLTQIMLITGMVILLRSILQLKKPLLYIVPLLTGFLLFRSVILTVQGGRLGGLFLLVLALFLFFSGKDQWFAAGALLPLLALKPNLGVPIIGLIGIILLIRKKWVAFIGIALASLVLLAAGWIKDPNWVSAYLNIGSGKLSQTFGFSPSLWGVTTYLCGFRLRCSLEAGGTVSLILLGGVAYFFYQKQIYRNISWSISLLIAFVLFLTPYLWVYDQVLLVIPICVIILEMIHQKTSYLLTASLFPLFSLLSLILLKVGTQIDSDIWSSIIPALLLFILLFLGFKSHKKDTIPQTEYLDLISSLSKNA